MTIGGALTFAAEEIASLFRPSGGSWENENKLTHHISVIEKAVQTYEEEEAHHQEAIIQNNRLLANAEAEEHLDAFLIRTDQIIGKIVEDHRDLVHKVEDLFVKVLHPSLIPQLALETALTNMNQNLKKLNQEVMLESTQEVFEMPFSVLEDQQAIIVMIHVPIGNRANVLDLYKVHTLPFSVGTGGTITQLHLPPYFVMDTDLTIIRP